MAKLTKELEIKLIENNQFLKVKEIDGVIIGVLRFAFTIAIMYDVDVDGGYQHRFCYPYEYTKDCLMAFEVWDGLGDPPGHWLKNKGWGVERRNPLIPAPFEERIKQIEEEKLKNKNN